MLFKINKINEKETTNFGSEGSVAIYPRGITKSSLAESLQRRWETVIKTQF